MKTALLTVTIALFGASAAAAQTRGPDGNLIRTPSANVSMNRNVYGNLARQPTTDQQPRFHPNARQDQCLRIR
jgi:hypothetical protein